MWLRHTIGLSLALLLVSAVTIVKQAHSAQAQPNPSAKAKHGKPGTAEAYSTAKRHAASKSAPQHGAGTAEAPATAHGPPDQQVDPLQGTGRPEIGSAAWYGPRHLGHRTASGDRLDGIHATAAHRSLPLNSLARVTNLRNGRSVVVKVTDRGPWRSNLLIDVSPKAAEELDMKRAGVVPVRIEPVVRATSKSQLASGHVASVN